MAEWIWQHTSLTALWTADGRARGGWATLVRMPDAVADLVRLITDAGGVVRAGQVRTRRHALARAVAAGAVIRASSGVYCLPTADPALAAAIRLNGARSHLSAALAHGWAVACGPARPQVIVPAGRSVRARIDADVRWRPLSPAERSAHLTSPVNTVLDCARCLPFVDALCVADSALRSGMHPEALRRRCMTMTGPGAPQAKRVIRHATALAANPFESALRAHAIEAGMQVEAQVEVTAPGFLARVDVVDRRRRIALEADSFAWHGDRQALRRDAYRYSVLTSLGWRVLRFSWEAVFLDPESVRRLLTAVVATPLASGSENARTGLT